MARAPLRVVSLTPRGSNGVDAAETVETHLFAALRATRLIAADATWAQCGYSRCGRTDKGVSALRQLVALKLRGAAPGAEALDYVALLNRQLPADIRVLSWRLAPEGFSARFRRGAALSLRSHAGTHASCCVQRAVAAVQILLLGRRHARRGRHARRSRTPGGALHLGAASTLAVDS